MLIYLAIVLISLVSCAIGFACEINDGNIRHLENRRKPNAGAALLPNIPLSQIFYVLVAWLGNKVYTNAGFMFAIAIGCIAIVAQVISCRTSTAKLAQLLKNA
ncbi:MAG: hypothetical protein V4805_09035 [Pseudomonadota bacterium]